MNVFVSWSGDRSKTIANALKQWLPDVFQGIRVWMSDRDIQAGARWSSELGGELEKSKIGIICLTPENLQSAWLIFEAGALSKSLNESRVAPYRFQLRAADVGLPLSQFQGVDANEEGTFKLVQSINNALGNPLPDEERTRRAFAAWWPRLEKTLSEIPRTAMQEIGGQIVGKYRAEGSPHYINTISHLGGEIFRIVNIAWEGVGLYDGETYYGIYKYNDAEPKRCGTWGTHEAELVFKEGRGVLRVQGWEMLEVSGLTRWKEPGEWFKADG